jgi:hypothetical protein
MDIALIVGTIATVIVIYIIYRNFFAPKGATTLTSQHPGTSAQTVAASSVTGSNAANYSFSIWMYIENWGYRYGSQKMVLERGNGAVQVYLDGELNNLVFKTNLQQKAGDSNVPPTASCTLENIPLQTWTNVVIVVQDRAVSMYLDGKLVRSCLFDSVPQTVVGSDFQITPDSGFQGYTAGATFYSRAIGPAEVYGIYKSGYGGGSIWDSIFGSYGIRISLVDGGATIGSIGF